MEFTIRQVSQLLNGNIQGDDTLIIKNFANIEMAKTGDISFLANLKYESFFYTSQASAIIVSQSFEPKKAYTATLIVVEDAYEAIATLLDTYDEVQKFSKIGIEQPSFIADSASCGNNIYRGAFSYIGQHTIVGNNVKIHPHVYVGDNVRIGDNCILYAGVKVCNGTIIGNNCILHPNAVVGSDGFGFAPLKDGSYKITPQLGNVVLEDDVSIGSNTTIDCATLPNSSTILRQGVKIDNLVQIAHNVEIGKHTVIAAQTGISGSTKIGENCQIGGQVGIAGHLEIANHTRVTAKTGVSKSFKTQKLVLGGNPAVENSEYLRRTAQIKGLPKLEERIKALEENNNLLYHPQTIAQQ